MRSRNMINTKIARNILKTYEEAWVEQDVRKILSIFSNDGIYHEVTRKKPLKGHKEIRNYWLAKVCTDESDIKFRLLNYRVIKDTIIAEWSASFLSKLSNTRIHIQEVAIIDIEDNKIKSFREYWHNVANS